MADPQYDVIVIGAGPGGYVAAIRAAQLGLKTACVEKRATLGGTCLNVGCIPSKALLFSSEKLEEARHGLAVHGVKVGEVGLDLPAMMTRKDKTVGDNVKGIEFLFKKNKVDWLKGAARIVKPGEIAITGADGKASTATARNVVIATGSDHMDLPGVAIDETRIVSSTGALTLPAVPKRMIVVGGGYIGLEMGSVWRRLGAAVTVVEFLDRIVPTMDGEIGKQFQRILQRQGMTFRLGSRVVGAETDKTGVTLSVQPANGGATETLAADVVLVAIGRRPHLDGLGLDAAGVTLDNRGRVMVDAHFETSVPGIYAIGDCIPGPMLAHKAEDEGMAVAELLAGQAGHVNYDVIPGVVYTWPEVASVGRTEEEAKANGAAVKVGKFPFTANARARGIAMTDGLVKIVADAKTDRVLGVHVLGAEAGTIIHEAAMAMEFGASAEDIARTCHAHPTLNEAVKEAALAVAGRPIHI